MQFEIELQLPVDQFILEVEVLESARGQSSKAAATAWKWKTLASTHAEFSQGIEHSQLALVIHEKHFNRHDYLIWKAYGTVQPMFVLRADGVPIVSVYGRPR